MIKCKTCETCKFYDEETTTCRINPPIPVAGCQGGQFPCIKKIEWCGKHEPKYDAWGR